jgi:hypothetical protein
MEDFNWVAIAIAAGVAVGGVFVAWLGSKYGAFVERAKNDGKEDWADDLIRFERKLNDALDKAHEPKQPE